MNPPNIHRSAALPRRHFLRSAAGGLFALPWLESLARGPNLAHRYPNASHSFTLPTATTRTLFCRKAKGGRGSFRLH